MIINATVSPLCDLVLPVKPDIIAGIGALGFIFACNWPWNWILKPLRFAKLVNCPARCWNNSMHLNSPRRDLLGCSVASLKTYEY